MRLVFFGDSFTFGQGYPDVKKEANGSYTYPSKLGWVTQVSRALYLESVNASSTGASNQQIFYDIRRFQFKPGDYAIIQWSFADRDLIYNDTGFVTQIGIWDNTKVVNHYYRAHNDYDMAVRAAFAIEHAILWLQHFDIPYIMFSNEPYEDDTDLLVLDNEKKYCVDQHPDKHPGEETNRIWAKKVVEYIKSHPRGTRLSIPRVASQTCYIRSVTSCTSQPHNPASDP